jgi:hypothetical protein
MIPEFKKKLTGKYYFKKVTFTKGCIFKKRVSAMIVMVEKEHLASQHVGGQIDVETHVDYFTATEEDLKELKLH